MLMPRGSVASLVKIKIDFFPVGGSPGTTDSELLVENGLTLSCIFLRVLGGGFLFALCCVLVNVPSEDAWPDPSNQ